MRNLAVGVVGLCLVGLSCTPAPITRAKIGAACTGENTMANCETGATCLHSICSKQCDKQGGDLHPSDGTLGGCPPGFDCGIALAGDAIASCYAVTYDTSMGGFLTGCATYAMGCGQAMNPCATGAMFDCHSPSQLACDPEAYCTKGCKLDTDCPPTMFCGYDCAPNKPCDTSAKQLCLTRTSCSDCATDDQCPIGTLCAQDGKGNHHCQQTCGATTDCPQPQYGTNFSVCLTDKSGKGKFCTNANGFCAGPSAVMGVPDNGVCAGCRLGVPTDCSTGEFCFRDEFTTEAFCTKSCKVTISSQGQPSNDSCMNANDGTFCYNGLQAGGTFNGLCTGDSAYGGTTCYPN